MDAREREIIPRYNNKKKKNSWAARLLLTPTNKGLIYRAIYSFGSPPRSVCFIYPAASALVGLARGVLDPKRTTRLELSGSARTV